MEEAVRCQRLLTEARQIMMLEPPESTEKKWLMMEEKETRRLEEIMEQLEDMEQRKPILDGNQSQEDKIKELEAVTKHESEDEESEDESDKD